MFIPWVFSFGAELEGLSIGEFLGDATKLSNSLRTIHNFFQCDGVVSHGDTLLLAEVIGCMVVHDGFPAKITSPCGFPDDFEIRTDMLPQTGRVATALDVMQRLTILLPNTLLLSIVPGPVTLAAQLTGMPAEEVCRDPGLIGSTVRAVLALTKAMGDSGIDMLIVHEDNLPKLDDETAKYLRRSYAPLWNTAKFYDLSPLLMLGKWHPENLERLEKFLDGFVVPAGSIPDNKKNSKKISISLPVPLLEEEPEEILDFLERHGILGMARESSLFLLTTDGEVPPSVHKESMIRGIQTIREAIFTIAQAGRSI